MPRHLARFEEFHAIIDQDPHSCDEHLFDAGGDSKKIMATSIKKLDHALVTGASRSLGAAMNDFHASGFENLPKPFAIFGIAVEDQVRLAQGEAIHGVDEPTSHLLHLLGVGRQSRAAHLDAA